MRNSAWVRTTVAYRILFTLVFIGTLGLPTATLAQEQHPLVISANERVMHDVSTVEQDIEVYGTVEGDVTSWSGNITVQGHVTGDVVSYTGAVTITSRARVDGSILSVNGELHRGAEAHISGQMVDGLAKGGTLASLVDLFTMRHGTDNVLPPSRTSLAGIRTLGRIFFGVVLGGFLLVLCLLWVAVWPHRTATAALVLRVMPSRSLVVGLLTTLILTLLLLPLVAFLTVTLIGVPLIAVLCLLIQIPYVYGLATLAQALNKHSPSKRLPTNVGLDRKTCTMIVIAVALLGLVTAIAPLSGLLLFYLVASPGLGAVILSRGGLGLPRVI